MAINDAMELGQPSEGESAMDLHRIRRAGVFAPARPASLEIIIVNWNAGAALSQCIASVHEVLGEGIELRRLVVVDNASTDGSLEQISAGDLPLSVIRNTTNRGFAAGCNQGAAGSDADYLLFLNPDTRLFANSLDVPLAFMRSPENERVGIVGVQLVDDSGQVGRSCARFPTLPQFFVKMVGLDRIAPDLFRGFIMEEWAHDSSQEVDHVMGAFFLVRRGLFETLGGFDERFFVYLEDLDFSLRAHRLGWRSVYLADAQIYHKGGGTSEQVPAMRLYHSLRSRIAYGFKHLGPAQASAITAGTLLLEPIMRLLWAGARGSGREAREILRGYTLLWKAAPRILSRKPGGDEP